MVVEISDMEILCRKCFRTVHTGELFCRLHGGSEGKTVDDSSAFPELARELKFNN